MPVAEPRARIRFWLGGERRTRRAEGEAASRAERFHVKRKVPLICGLRVVTGATPRRRSVWSRTSLTAWSRGLKWPSVHFEHGVEKRQKIASACCTASAVGSCGGEDAVAGTTELRCS